MLRHALTWSACCLLLIVARHEVAVSGPPPQADEAVVRRLPTVARVELEIQGFRIELDRLAEHPLVTQSGLESTGVVHFLRCFSLLYRGDQSRVAASLLVPARADEARRVLERLAADGAVRPAFEERLAVIGTACLDRTVPFPFLVPLQVPGLQPMVEIEQKKLGLILDLTARRGPVERMELTCDLRIRHARLVASDQAEEAYIATLIEHRAAAECELPEDGGILISGGLGHFGGELEYVDRDGTARWGARAPRHEFLVVTRVAPAR